MYCEGGPGIKISRVRKQRKGWDDRHKEDKRGDERGNY